MLERSAEESHAPPAVLENNLAALNSLVSYCENESECRRTLLLRHFDETFHHSKCRGEALHVGINVTHIP
jgi:superfamily II DNA helicase RecQ